MDTNTKILCGIHALASRGGRNYFPVAVYLNTNNHLTQRETILLREEKCDSLGAVFDIIEEENRDVKNTEKWERPFFVDEYTTEELAEIGKLEPLRLYHPTKERIGEVIRGTVVGWHVDFRTNHGKKCPPVMVGNVAFHDEQGRVNFVTVSKKEFVPKSATHIGEMLAQGYEVMTEAVQLGGTLCVGVEALGKSRARFVVKEYIKPKTFMETVMQGVKEDLCLDTPSPSDG